MADRRPSDDIIDQQQPVIQYLGEKAEVVADLAAMCIEYATTDKASVEDMLDTAASCVEEAQKMQQTAQKLADLVEQWSQAASVEY